MLFSQWSYQLCWNNSYIVYSNKSYAHVTIYEGITYPFIYGNRIELCLKQNSSLKTRNLIPYSWRTEFRCWTMFAVQCTYIISSVDTDIDDGHLPNPCQCATIKGTIVSIKSNAIGCPGQQPMQKTAARSFHLKKQLLLVRYINHL